MGIIIINIIITLLLIGRICYIKLVSDPVFALKLSKFPEAFSKIIELEEVLTRYYELAELPFKNNVFLENENNLSNYREIDEKERIKNDSNKLEIELVLLLNNTIETKTKNPLFFFGFFSEKKFFL